MSDPSAWLRRLPAAPAATLGALSIAFSAPLVALSRADTVTASFYRCLFALPFLALFAALERRTPERMPRRQHVVALLAGVMLGADLLLWNQSVDEVGAGVSTVIVNLQVLLVPLLALAVDREPLSRRFGLAVVPMLVGVALAGGLGSAGTGDDPLTGTVHASLAALCYAGYLFLLRRGSTPRHLALPVLDVTLAAMLLSLLAAPFLGMDLTPGWPSIGWLAALALSGQVAGWLLIAVSLPKLPSRTGASLLLLQPVGALALGLLLLGQQPSLLQLVGSAMVLAAVLTATRDGRRRAA